MMDYVLVICNYEAATYLLKSLGFAKMLFFREGNRQ